ncbi:MAG TPA: hypothetical protein VLM05_19990 [Mycobacteriales bacterium]|nr:hypothetical protein [Mycobacteriales bacterium]
MKTSPLAAVGLLALALAGCSSDSPSGSASAGDVAASIKAQATSPAPAAASSAGGTVDRSKDCPDAILAAKAALSGMSVTDVSLPEGCTVVFVQTPVTDKEIGKDMCDKVAGEVYQLGIVGIAVESDAGDSLALGAPSQPCHTL